MHVTPIFLAALKQGVERKLAATTTSAAHNKLTSQQAARTSCFTAAGERCEDVTADTQHTAVSSDAFTSQDPARANFKSEGLCPTTVMQVCGA
jgi:hypothetical protein